MSLGMPRLSASLVGSVAGPRVQAIDARWLAAYAAGLGERDPRCYDTLAPEGPRAHPLFSVCYEWPLAVELRERVIGTTLAARSVHLTHDLVIHRPPRAGDTLTTTARVVEVTPHRAGTLIVVALETADAHGAPVSTTRYGSLYRDVHLEGPVRPARPAPTPPPAVTWEETIEVAAGAAHVYTECARIWNPIHTDPAAARAAGLPAIILHGTATLALAVSRVVGRELGGESAAVRGVRTRFTGMVPLPSTVVVRGRGRRDDHVLFDAVDGAGRSVLTEGVVVT
jgi:acyl dehydratase